MMTRSLTLKIHAPVLLLMVGLTAPLTAQTLKTFTNGEVADAGAVNDNFTVVKAAATAADAKAATADAKAVDAATKADAAQGAANAASAEVSALNGRVTPLVDAVKVDGNGNVGIGTGTPSGNLDVTSATGSSIVATAHGSNAPGFAGRQAGGTPSAPTPTTTGTPLGVFSGSGYTGSAFVPGANITMSAAENWSASARGSEITFATTFRGTASPNPRMVIAHDGAVGIGTTTPGSSYLLDVNGSAHVNGEALFGTGTQVIVGRAPRGGLLSLGGPLALNYDSGDVIMAGASGSRVGIGTTTPRAKVEIRGFVNSNTGNAFGQLGLTGATGNHAAQTVSVSLLVDTGILCNYVFALSDARIKRIEGRSDAVRDLATLRGIEVTDYTHIDAAVRGGGTHKKVVAQQVERVFPQAVSRNTDVVPDIYQRAQVEDGWVRLATDLKQGERVRLIGTKTEGIHEVLEVRDGGFRTDFVADEDTVFVYGREVDDFRSVDYDAISMLNVSATQELARQIEAKDAELATLRAQNDALARLVSALEAADDAQQARLSRLEEALELRQPASRAVGAK